MRESRIERNACKDVESVGVLTAKLGDQGWPDRVVFVHQGFFLAEFKQPGADFTPAQKRRIPKLRKAGFAVCVIEYPYELAVAYQRFVTREWSKDLLFTKGVF